MRLVKLATGISLVELMIIIAIVALLSVVASPAYKRYLDKSHMAEFNNLVKAQLELWSEYHATDPDYLNANTMVTLTSPISYVTFTPTGVQFALDYYPSIENSSGGPLPTDSKALPFLFVIGVTMTYTADLSVENVIKWNCTMSFGAGNEYYGGTMTNQELVDEFFPNCTL